MSEWPGLRGALFPDGWARHGAWPNLASSRASSPLMVQYDRGDHLFTPEGMLAAHERIASLYAQAGQPDAYEGRFYAAGPAGWSG
jgi:hypothetical protein